MANKKNSQGEKKTYRLVWKQPEGKNVGTDGKGSSVFSSVEDAKEVADEMDRLYPEMRHWVEEV